MPNTYVAVDLNQLYQAHDNQARIHRRLVKTKDGDIVHKPEARTLVVVAGRGFGKGLGAVNDGVHLYTKRINQPIPRHLNPAFNMWALCPSFRSGQQQWADLKFYVPEKLLVEPRVRESQKDLHLFRDGYIQQRSWGDEGETLEGTGLDFLWITEVFRLPQAIWDHQLKPMLLRKDRLGIAFLEGKPLEDETETGDWIWDLLDEGMDPSVPDVAGWRFTAFDNPLLSDMERKQIWREKDRMSDAAWRQEIMAERLDTQTRDLRNIEACTYAEMEPEKPREDTNYVIGIDIGQKRSRTFIVIGDRERRKVVNVFTMSKTDWPSQKSFIIEKAKEYSINTQALLKMDASGLGTAISDDLAYAGLAVDPIVMEGHTKHDLYSTAVLAFEKETIRIPKRFEVLINELKHMQAKPTAHGYKSWKPAKGWRDDAADAFVLMLSGMTAAPISGLQFAGFSRNRLKEHRVIPDKYRQHFGKGTGVLVGGSPG